MVVGLQTENIMRETSQVGLSVRLIFTMSRNLEKMNLV